MINSCRATSIWIVWAAVILVVAGFILPQALFAAQVTLAWDQNQEQNLAGYNLYYRTCSLDDACDTIGPQESLSQVGIPLDDLSNEENPRHTLADLTDNRKYVFVVTAYGQDDVESGFSNEAYFTASSDNPPSSYTIQSNAGPNGSISPMGAVIAQPNTNLIFTITPNSGYRIDDVLVDGQSVGAVSTYTFHSIAADHSIQAIFISDTYLIRASSGPNGSIAPQGDIVVQRGANRIFTITPDSGYRTSDVTVDGQSMGSLETYTFHEVTDNHDIYASFTTTNRAPQADAGRDQRVSPNSTVTLDGSRSSDADGNIQSYEWIQIGTPQVQLNNAETTHPSFTAPDPGPQGATLVFQLTVTDAMGLSSTDRVSVMVDGNNQPPVIDQMADQTTALGTPFTLSAPFTDANPGDSHQATILWGDGTPWEAGVIEADQSRAIGRHTYNSPGSYRVSICVSDSDGATDCGDFELLVEGSGIPVAIVQADFDGDQDGFEYVDYPFSPVGQPEYAQGSLSEFGGYSGGALMVTLGGQDDNDIYDISGGWQTTFSLDRATEVALFFRYSLTQWPGFEEDEYSQVILTLDGETVTIDGNDYIAEIWGDGGGGEPLTTGWQTLEINLGSLSPGEHTLVIGGYNNKKTYHNEITEVYIDDAKIIGMFADGGRPTGGYEIDNLIPAAQINQSREGDGCVTIQFKIKDPAARSCSLYQFAYSIDGGNNWMVPEGGDQSPALADGWQNNAGSRYSTAATFGQAGMHIFTVDTKHSSLPDLRSTELDDVRIRFRVNNGSLDSALATVSEPFSISNLGPAVAISYGGIDHRHVGVGTLTITASLSKPSTLVPTITIETPGEMAAIGPTVMETGSEPDQYRYSLFIEPHDGTSVIDGTYHILVDNVEDANGNRAIGRASFHTDTIDSDGDGLRNYDDPDDDNDQLPDDWERMYGLDPLNSSGIHGAAGDFDDDGYTNLEEYLAGTDPAEQIASLRPRVIATIPHSDAGIGADEARIPNNASFCALVQAPNGVDLTDPESVSLQIDDGQNRYDPDCSDRNIVRFVQLIAEEDENHLTKFWLIYNRQEDVYGDFGFGSLVNVGLDMCDISGICLPTSQYQFQIETQDEYSQSRDNAPQTSALPETDPMLEPESGYDTGIVVTSGENEGVKVIFDSAGSVIPEIGPSEEIPVVTDPDLKPLGSPLNIQPPTVSESPLKIVIPCPGETDLSDTSILFYNGDRWIRACNAKGELLETGEGWMVPDSRKIHTDTDNGITTVEFKAYQLSGIQVVRDAAHKSEGGGASPLNCFIDTARF
jgi:hypothetical protein